jgi:tripartite-type tricarboxylate transporter receptor subunit TctC
MYKTTKKLVLTCLVGLIPTLSLAWEPTKPVNVVIAYGPGSGNEILFRKIDSIIKKTNKNVTFVLEFKPGANELVGMNHFAQAANDGYTIYAPAVGVWIGTPVWYKKSMIQDPIEWSPIVSLGEAPLALYASNESKVNNPREFSQALTAGAKINVGVGAAVHVLSYEYMAKQTNATNAQRIQFNSPAAVAQAVSGNQIEFGISPLPIALELAKAGKLKIIGITGNIKGGPYPNIADTFKGLDLVGQIGIVLPKNTSKEILDFYIGLFTEAVNSPEYLEFLKETNWFDTMYNHNNFKAFIFSQRKKWIPVAETIQFN